ncbi:hypothetical protein DPMN_028400 [Dreissena polymorpha]|uniref:Uncharacterized protein n=1 Tax=Dreissena polymorpha TaxID=45954 RepID=A0A9D4LYX2_DREPO|nr:hypothetical protein DPMN_028400 [Dreissena polymorpha]
MLHLLHEGLDALRVALFTRELQYYMIPDRNLMTACGLEEEQKSTWISTITEMMNEGPSMIMRLPKIRQALIPHPEPFRWFNCRKMELDLLYLAQMNRVKLCRDENWVVDSSDVILHAIHRRMYETMSEVRLMMIIGGSGVHNMADVYNGPLM